MDETVKEYIKLNRDLIQNYFVMRYKDNFLCLYISAEKPLELKGDELIEKFAKKQIELNVITPSEYKEVADIMGVVV